MELWKGMVIPTVQYRGEQEECSVSKAAVVESFC